MRIDTINTCLIRRPVEEVFQFIATDYFKNFPLWQPDMKEVKQTSLGRMGVGTTGHVVSRDKTGNGLDASLSVREYRPNSLFTIHGEGSVSLDRQNSKGDARLLTAPTQFDWIYSFEPAGAQTQFRLTNASATVTSPINAIFTPLTYSNWVEQNMILVWRIKNLLESSAGLPSTKAPNQVNHTLILTMVIVFFITIIHFLTTGTDVLTLGFGLSFILRALVGYALAIVAYWVYYLVRSRIPGKI